MIKPKPSELSTNNYRGVDSGRRVINHYKLQSRPPRSLQEGATMLDDVKSAQVGFTTGLEWMERRATETNDVAQHKIRETINGEYRVVEVVPTQTETAINHGFYAMAHGWTRQVGDTWSIISVHKSEHDAKEACEQHSEEGV